MKLMQLAIHDFKGIHDLQIDFNGKNVNIYGENGTGKTTVYDAFLWLLFDRDSTNRKDFAIKPRGIDGEEVHHLRTRVKGCILNDGKRIRLEKAMVEKWRKKRGESIRVFIGHESEYFVDEMPLTKGEYQAVIARLMDEGTFRTITNPGYFNCDLSWQERRAKLFGLAGCVEEKDETLAMISGFFPLAGILQGKNADEARKTIQYSLKKMKEKMLVIPVRIDEIKISMPSPFEWDELEKRREYLYGKLKDTEEKIADIQATARAFATWMEKIEYLKRQMKARADELKHRAGQEQREAAFEMDTICTQIKRLGLEKEESADEAENAARMAGIFREEAAVINAKIKKEKQNEYEPCDLTNLCALCGQPLPKQMAAKAEEERKRSYEAQRQHEAAALAARLEETERSLERMDKQAAKARERGAECEKRIKGMKERVDELKTISEKEIADTDPLLDKEYCRMAHLLQKEEKKKIPNHKAALQNELDKKKQLCDGIFSIEKKLAQKTQFEAAQSRLAELACEMRDLASTAGEQEETLAKLERFTAYKCSMMENRINAMFESVKWKLFDIQINGGVNECCECLIEGVPYADANSAARINTGLEIIDVFSRAGGVSAPIFIDNRESICNLYPVCAQVVSLVVSSDRTLRIEATLEGEAVGGET